MNPYSDGRRGPSRPLLVSTRQRGNRLLKYLNNVRWEYSETVLPDYVMGGQACALYLSIKYHLLHPEYILTRMRQLGSKFNLSIVLCLVDVEGSTQPLEELMLLCTNMGFTLICAWSLAEAARYLETYKAYENKGAKIIKEQVQSGNPYAVLSDCLTAVRGVNKTDVLTLSSTFGSLKNIIDCSMEELSLCPGLGPRKVKNLYETFHAPFDPTKKKKQKTEAQIESFLSRKVRTKKSVGTEPEQAAPTSTSNRRRFCEQGQGEGGRRRTRHKRRRGQPMIIKVNTTRTLLGVLWKQIGRNFAGWLLV